MLGSMVQDVTTFKFIPGDTPLSAWYVPVSTVCVYLLTIFTIKRYIRRIRKQGFELRWLVFLHNFAMTACSSLLFALLSIDLLTSIAKYGLLETYGDMRRQTAVGTRCFLFYAHYLLQYVQLFDTVLLALRDRPLVFFHVYSHAASIVLAWSQLRAQSSFQWVPIILSLATHALLYGYYSLHTLKKRSTWKRFLTIAQISQLTIALLAVVPALAMRTLHDLGWWRLPKCNVNYEASYFAVFIMSSYLGFFSLYYRDNYRRRQQAGRHLEEKDLSSKSEPLEPQDVSYTIPSDTVMDLEMKMKMQEDAYSMHQRHSSFVMRRNSVMMAPRSPLSASYNPAKFSL